MGTIINFPTADPVPASTGDAYLDDLEMQLIRGVAGYVQVGWPASLRAGRKLAERRHDYLLAHPELPQPVGDSARYLSSLVIAIKKLPPRQQAKLRHPARSRGEAQIVIERGHV